MKSAVKTGIQYAVITLIGVLFLYFVFKGTDWNELLDKFANTDYRWIAAGMGVALFSHYIRAYRAIMLYEPLGYSVPVKNSLYAVLIGYMMNYIIPRGGEVSRCASLTKTDGIPINKTLGTVVTERVFDMVMLFLAILLAFFMQFDLLSHSLEQRWNASMNPSMSGTPGSYTKMILLGILVLLLVVFFVARKRVSAHPLYLKMITLLKGFGEGLMSVRQVKNPVLFILLSIAIWACYLLMMYFCFFAMEATKDLDFMACLTVFALGTIGMVIPAPGAGAGTYHFAIMQSLVLYGVSQEDGIAYATIVHGVQMILLLCLGGVCSGVVLVMQKKKAV